MGRAAGTTLAPGPRGQTKEGHHGMGKGLVATVMVMNSTPPIPARTTAGQIDDDGVCTASRFRTHGRAGRIALASGIWR